MYGVKGVAPQRIITNSTVPLSSTELYVDFQLIVVYGPKLLFWFTLSGLMLSDKTTVHYLLAY